MSTWNALWLLPLFPLLGSIICGALHFRILAARRRDPKAETPEALVGWIGSGAVAASLVVSIIALVKLMGHDSPTVLASAAWPWLDAGSFSVDLSMVVDRLSSVMILVVTGVGLLIHVYSIGYMAKDPGFAKFFAFMNLFIFTMLVLVLSSSLLGLFVGWEGVGLCSYLLIGFWYEKGWPAEAGQKAFVVNRIGDACFLVGSFILIGLFGTLDIQHINEGVRGLMAEHPDLLALSALLLFGGACGKSAQIPLFTWLPDAMAGPTPVSALIHAATMVTAGVYLVVRLNPLFAASPTILAIIGIVGAMTALVGASTALMQRDIKKVLAYSTVSQLGYMFLGLACGAWGAAIFHLVTHAFFKGLLFLSSGSVIHGMHDEQDMYKYGGLKEHMPRTYTVFIAGAAALSGLPLLSGYFSKDEILAHAIGHGGFYVALWIVGVFTAALTAYYTWRMVALTFYGGKRFDVEHVHPHESPSIMIVPLQILAVLAVVGGLLNLPHILPLGQVLGHWLEPVVEEGNAILFASTGGHPSHHTLRNEILLLLFGAAIAVYFARKGYKAYIYGTGADERFTARRPRVAEFLEHAWKVDESYTARVVAPIKLLAFVIASTVDQVVFDGPVNGAGRIARSLGGRLRIMIDGNVKSYALWMSAGAALLAILWIWS